MLTQERLDTLRATANGTVKVKRIAAPGNPYKVEPRDHTVRFGFLLKARLLEVDGSHVELTERVGMLSPAFQRDLIRLANRDRLTAEDVSGVVEYAQMMVPRTGAPEDLLSAQAVLDVWKESFNDVEP